jgi:hypothetical protein
MSHGVHAQVGVQLVCDSCATWRPIAVYPNMQMSPCTLMRRPLTVQIKIYRFSERPPHIGTEGSFLSIFKWTSKIDLSQQQCSHTDALKEIICCQYNDQAVRSSFQPLRHSCSYLTIGNKCSLGINIWFMERSNRHTNNDDMIVWSKSDGRQGENGETANPKSWDELQRSQSPYPHDWFCCRPPMLLITRQVALYFQFIF